MAAVARRPVVYVLSHVRGLVDTISSLKPDIQLEVIPVDTESGLTGDYEISEANLRKLKDAEVILADPNRIASSLYKFPNLKWLQSTWAGPDKLFKYVDSSKLPTFTLTRFGGVFGADMTEYVIGHIIARERKIYEGMLAQQKCEWVEKSLIKYRRLTDLSIGILGLGDIGKDVARACKMFGMTVWGLVRHIPVGDKVLKDVSEYRTLDQLPEVLQNCDYICNILPSTSQTRGLLSGNMLANCQSKKAVFINVGRGDIVDDDALVNALQSGWLSGAILDVFNTEPLPETSPLWKLPGVTITPHIAAVTMADQMASLFVDNYERYISGHDLKFVVSWEAGY